jgi:hypothetical protein
MGPKEQTIFYEPLAKNTIETLYNNLNSARALVQQAGDKYLTDIFNTFSNEINNLINGTKITYNILFSKAGKDGILKYISDQQNKGDSNLLSFLKDQRNKFDTINTTIRRLKPQLTQASFWYPSKRNAHDFLIKLADGLQWASATVLLAINNLIIKLEPRRAAQK